MRTYGRAAPLNELRAKDYAIAAQPSAPPSMVDQGSQSGGATTDILSILWRRKFLIAAIVLIAVALGYLWAKSATPRYTASATLKLDVYQPGIADIESVVSGITGDTREVRSQLQILRSRLLLGRVVDALELHNDPEFNPRLRPVDTGTNYLSLSYWLIQAGILPEPPKERPQLPPAETRERAIDALIARTTVIPVHFSFVFSVSVQTESPQKSAEIANVIADQYILNQIEVKYDATATAAGWLSNRVAELKTSLEDAEEAVAEHRATHELTSEQAVGQLSQRLISLRQTLAEVGQSRRDAEAKLIELRRLFDANELTEVAKLTGSIRLENLATTIEENGGPSAQRNQAAVVRFNAELQAVLNRLRREVTASEENISKLTASVTELELRQAEQSSNMVVLRQLEREAQAASLIYETFLSRLKETTVQEGVHKADAIVISKARIPTSRSFPRYRTVLAAALFIGLFIAGAIVVLLETIDQTFSTPEELERFTGLPLLGLIPNAPVSARSNILKYAISRPTSPFVEAIRNLRTSVQLSGVDGDVKVVALASATEGEGKTSLCLALGHSSATQANRKVLVLDCDLRRRRLTAALGGRGMPGIIGYFSGDKTIEEIIHRIDTAEFDVIFADKSPKITADIFASQKFADLIAVVRERYDFVIIDTPPVLALTDIRVISGLTDMLLFSISYKRTKRRLVRAGLSALAMTNPKRIAVVFNRMNIGKSIGYYGSYYYNK